MNVLNINSLTILMLLFFLFLFCFFLQRSNFFPCTNNQNSDVCSSKPADCSFILMLRSRTPRVLKRVAFSNEGDRSILLQADVSNIGACLCPGIWLCKVKWIQFYLIKWLTLKKKENGRKIRIGAAFGNFLSPERTVVHLLPTWARKLADLGEKSLILFRLSFRDKFHASLSGSGQFPRTWPSCKASRGPSLTLAKAPKHEVS